MPIVSYAAAYIDRRACFLRFLELREGSIYVEGTSAKKSPASFPVLCTDVDEGRSAVVDGMEVGKVLKKGCYIVQTVPNLFVCEAYRVFKVFPVAVELQ